MPTTKVSQTRQQLQNTHGDIVYRIISVVTDQGDLPQPAIFVYKIEDPDDPSYDAFQRIASPYDLTTLTIGRPAAVAAGVQYFLSTYSSRDFDALEVAMQAMQEINGRVSTLASTYNTYMSSFYTATAEALEFPNADPSYVQQLTDAYSDAKEARIVAEEDLEEKSTELTTSESELAAAVAQTAMLKTLWDYCTSLRDSTSGSWTLLQSAITTYVTQTNTFFGSMIEAYEAWNEGVNPWDPTTGPPPFSDWYPMWDAMRIWWTGGRVAWEANGVPKVTLVADTLTAMCNFINTNYAAAVNSQSQAYTAVSSATEAKEKATAVLAAAQEAEDAALAAIKAVCPSFDPASV